MDTSETLFPRRRGAGEDLPGIDCLRIRNLSQDVRRECHFEFLSGAIQIDSVILHDCRLHT